MKYFTRLFILIFIISCKESPVENEKNVGIKITPLTKLQEANSFVLSVENWNPSNDEIWRFTTTWEGIDSVKGNKIYGYIPLDLISDTLALMRWDTVDYKYKSIFVVRLPYQSIDYVSGLKNDYDSTLVFEYKSSVRFASELITNVLEYYPVLYRSIDKSKTDFVDSVRFDVTADYDFIERMYLKHQIVFSETPDIRLIRYNQIRFSGYPPINNYYLKDGLIKINKSGSIVFGVIYSSVKDQSYLIANRIHFYLDINSN